MSLECVYLGSKGSCWLLCPFTCQSIKSRKEINLTISWSWFWFWPLSLLHCIFLQADLSESFLLIFPWRSFHGLGSAIELTGSIKLIKTFWKPHLPSLLVNRCGIFLDGILWGIGKEACMEGRCLSVNNCITWEELQNLGEQGTIIRSTAKGYWGN